MLTSTYFGITAMKKEISRLRAHFDQHTSYIDNMLALRQVNATNEEISKDIRRLEKAMRVVYDALVEDRVHGEFVSYVAATNRFTFRSCANQHARDIYDEEPVYTYQTYSAGELDGTLLSKYELAAIKNKVNNTVVRG